MYNRGQIISEEERKTIYDWVINLRPKMEFLSNNRRNYRIVKGDPNIPDLVFDIRDRLEKKEGLENYQKEEHIKDFIGMISPGGFIFKHADPNDFEKKLIHVRFNIYISVPKEGSKTYYAGQLVETKECCYVMCRSGVDVHWTEPIEDEIPRISFSFGYMLPPEKIDELCDPKYGTYKNMYPLAKYAYNMTKCA